MPASILILSFLSLLLAAGTRAQKPPPFGKEYTFEASSGVRLVSTNTGGDGYSTEGATMVYGARGRLLYGMPVFTGRRKICLSDDGRVLVLDGNVHFRTSVMRPPADGDDEVVTSVYLDGKFWKGVLYNADLQGEPLKKGSFMQLYKEELHVPAVVKNKIMTGIMGGGERDSWVKRPFSMEVDWDRNVLVYAMNDRAETVEIPLPDVGKVAVKSES